MSKSKTRPNTYSNFIKKTSMRRHKRGYGNTRCKVNLKKRDERLKSFGNFFIDNEVCLTINHPLLSV